LNLVKLFVASVYAPSPWNKEWYALQWKFIFQNTKGIDVQFGILLNGVEVSDLGSDVNVIGDMGSNTGHSAGMAELVRIFRASDCTHFLFLDSDCFPVHPDWFNVLVAQMKRFNKRFAAPIRYENLDRFPHPCAFFCDAESIKDDHINFEIGFPSENILNETVRDVGNAMLPLLPEILPLIRTNRVNPHPIAAGIYHHLFYHHGAGSRNFEFRLIDKYKYCEHWWSSEQDDVLAEELRAKLFDNPEEFLRGIM
jgi:hypothetical protein